MKDFFLSRLFREKILLLGLLFIGLAIWFSSYSKRAGLWMKSYSATSSVLTVQEQWLKEKAAIDARAAAAVQLLDASRTLSALRLQAELEQLARSSGLSLSTRDANTEKSSQFSEHSLVAEMRNADYGSIVNFYKSIVARSPYIGIKSFQLYANPGNPAQLSLGMKITSVEITR